jgi:hypothetical protein
MISKRSYREFSEWLRGLAFQMWSDKLQIPLFTNFQNENPVRLEITILVTSACILQSEVLAKGSAECFVYVLPPIKLKMQIVHNTQLSYFCFLLHLRSYPIFAFFFI